jgi:hypothetical protein
MLLLRLYCREVMRVGSLKGEYLKHRGPMCYFFFKTSCHKEVIKSSLLQNRDHVPFLFLLKEVITENKPQVIKNSLGRTESLCSFKITIVIYLITQKLDSEGNQT